MASGLNPNKPLENSPPPTPVEEARSTSAHQTFSCLYRVTYADCTVGNHIYYGRYAELLEWARGEFFRFIGLPFLQLQEQGILFPVVHLSIDYKAPAQYDNLLRIEVWMTELRRSFLRFAYTIQKEDDPPSLVIQAVTRHLCTTLSGQPRRLPSELITRLKPFLSSTL